MVRRVCMGNEAIALGALVSLAGVLLLLLYLFIMKKSGIRPSYSFFREDYYESEKESEYLTRRAYKKLCADTASQGSKGGEAHDDARKDPDPADGGCSGETNGGQEAASGSTDAPSTGTSGGGGGQSVDPTDGEVSGGDDGRS